MTATVWYLGVHYGEPVTWDSKLIYLACLTLGIQIFIELYTYTLKENHFQFHPLVYKGCSVKVSTKWKIIAAYLKNTVEWQFPFWYICFRSKDISVFCYANNCATKMVRVKYSIKNISWNVGEVIFKLGTRNVHDIWNKMKAVMPLPRQLSWLVTNNNPCVTHVLS